MLWPEFSLLHRNNQYKTPTMLHYYFAGVLKYSVEISFEQEEYLNFSQIAILEGKNLFMLEPL